MRDIKTIIELINMDSSVMRADKNGASLVSLLLDIAEADVKSDDCKLALETIEKIRNANKNVPNFVIPGSGRLASVGMAAYSAKKHQAAETAFRMLAESGNTSAKNNYAYMIRRHEITNITDKDHIKALTMLRDGVKEGDAFSLVNTAIVFALMLGDDGSWHFADGIMQKLSEFGGMLVESWWEDLAKEDDIEGYLVHFFLLRHEKIEQSNLGSIKSIALHLKKNLDGFPNWLADNYTIETLDDVIGCINDSDFDSILEDFLEKMPCSRESVDEMIDAVSCWDLWAIYDKLLTECRSLLTTDEIIKLKSDYIVKFDLPLPGETE